ncbi:putative GNL3L Grn1 putative GTPase [Trypanosoma vivax]|uniref:Guanine nucleotide-binding protein-like 3 N-terminal domain-containing protein n=1 Tax=Trypanosoma vivax (strain Y486) TaxID=1055687 RepID=G0U4M1_TRYVY|nr:hypothetical protein TRVL_01815 [Trypanosoma vivax]KAH8611928.1 putative GNL3L Grn1 putative GTPase [Trypanosoma vivax]KAH8620820.1 putative GNL3L Grn1 putative GTPase [Trypanosoma vivax]CCC52385.1 conserved hypothetical protein [Trypanosoma vivax Y486]
MPKIRSGPSKRMSSRQRHKIERKKREHKRDLRRAAKALKKSGLGPKRSKKARELAKLALKVSNSHPDKESIIHKVLQSREEARVLRANKRGGVTDCADSQQCSPKEMDNMPRSQRKKVFTLIPAGKLNNFSYQFNRTLEDLVFPLPESSMQIPSVAYLITLDSRCTVQSLPLGLIDAVVHEGNKYGKNGGRRKILLLFALTKVDLISSTALVSQVSLLSHALYERYLKVSEDALIPGEVLRFALCPVSYRFDKTVNRIALIMKKFLASEGCSGLNVNSNLDGKLCTFVVGLPNTGRRTLCRALARHCGDSIVSIVPVSSTQVQLVKEEGGEGDIILTKLNVPNARQITLMRFSEDTVLIDELSRHAGGGVIFKPISSVEKMCDPDVVGCMLFDSAIDRVSLAQVFCQPCDDLDSALVDDDKITAAAQFFRRLGQTIRKEKGFYASPLFVKNCGTMGKLSSSSLTASVDFTSGQQSSRSTLLDASYSSATPNRLVRISMFSHDKRKHKKPVRRADFRDAVLLGARTFVREICLGVNVPWAVMRHPTGPLTMPDVELASTIFDSSLCCGNKLGFISPKDAAEHLTTLIDSVSDLMKQYLIFLPNNVVEFHPEFIAPPLHDLDEMKANENEPHCEHESCEEVEGESEYNSDEVNHYDECEELDDEVVEGDEDEEVE